MTYIKPLHNKEMNPETLNYVKKLGKIAYPDYKGRKWALGFQESYTMQNYWDGGSKTYSTGLELATGRMVKPGNDTTNPFKAAAHASFAIPLGYAIIERDIFQGKDMGIRLVINPRETSVPGYAPALPAPEAIPAIEG